MTGGIVFALTFLAALGGGLMTGLFFVFSAFMMTALARLPAGQGMAAMQSINVRSSIRPSARRSSAPPSCRWRWL
jgi:uncharacterized membrane protein